MKKQLLFGFISCIFFCTTCLKVNAQTPYNGIPYGFVPATLNELSTCGWAQMAHGNFANPGATLGPHPSGSTHAIITSDVFDSNTCSSFGIRLRTLPNIPDWNVEKDGPLRVMRLGDDRANNPLGSQITYYFKPDLTRNVIIVYFAFIAQNPFNHSYTENPKFRIDVQRANNQLINGGDKSSYFLVNPQGNSLQNNPAAHNDLLETYNSYFTCSSANTEWANWFPIAFDLRAYIGEEIRLKISSVDCSPTAHYAYGYYTVRGVNGTFDVSSCNLDRIKLSIPYGFHDYAWTVNGKTIVNNTNELDQPREINDTVISCTVTSKNGATMTFTTNIDYYEFRPAFTYTLKSRNCNDYQVQFSNTSELDIINGGKNKPQEIKNVLWDFGDTISTEINPIRNYSPGEYVVKMTLYDNDGKCDSTIVDTIRVSKSDDCYGFDTLRTCSRNFPFISSKYPDVIWDKSGDEQEVKFEGACPLTGCDSIVMVIVLGDYPDGERYDTITVCKDKLPYEYLPGRFLQEGANAVPISGDYDNDICDSTIYVYVKVQHPQVDIKMVGDFCNDFMATLVAETKSNAPQYLWNDGWAISDLPITEPGTYSVVMTDDLGCEATDKYKVNACLPYISLPSAFSPSNKDNTNDYFELKQTSLVQKLELAIYDRYGALVYYTDRKDFKWDGKVNDKIYYNATYVYILIITDYNETTTRHTGSITTL